ncbi:MAG: anthranilate synthase component I [Acidobacteria bacterium]|jgi:anthranilate synthase component 1|nr:MAG: anthranilate synthase component I [Acidobacteriota bacterium]GIU82544.1 MAG: anthranilate synthase component I [Pyrinomonadaceae bacterium]
MIKITPKSFGEFLEEAKKGNVVPVTRKVLADLNTPVSAFLQVCSSSDKFFLFESIEGGERLARYSFLAANPYLIVKARGRKIIVEEFGQISTLEDTLIFDYLKEHFAKRKLAVRSGLPPLCGGAVGFIAYDLIRLIEPILDDGKEYNTNDAVWMFFKNVIVFDHLRQTIEIVSVVFTDEAEEDENILRELYQIAIAETERIEKLLLQPIPIPVNPLIHNKDKRIISNFTKAEFIEAVKKIKEHILAGDVYQVVLSQNFKQETEATPINIYRALRVINPSPYMFLLRTGDETLIGSSPEMLIRVRGKALEYRPIAGTRKRGQDETEDWILGEDLRSDEKEIAEHIMLVDLGRNDLGKVAEFGSIEIEELMKIEKYSHVQHMVTSLKATLRSDLDCFDALVACFPAGTVSGAPKVSAMKIISELEPTPRGVYAGAVGYVDYAGNLDTCIAIRTIQIRGSTASIQAGAGIVADSVPEKEYEECLNKAKALIKAIEVAEKVF